MDTATLNFNATSQPNFWENPGNRTLTLTGTNTGPNTFAAVIPDIPGVTTSGISKTGPGTWVLSGNNTYGGQTNILAGILRIQSNTALGNGGFDGTTLTNVRSGGTLEIDGSLNSTEHIHFGGSGTGGIGAVRVISGTSVFTTMCALDDDGSGTVTFNTLPGTSLALTAQIYNDTNVTAGLTKIGAGTLVLGGPNTYGGATIVNGGTLQLTGAGTIGAANSSVQVNNGATLDLGGTTQVIGQMNNGGVGAGAVGTITNGTLNLNGNNFFLQSGTMDANLTGGGSSRLWIGGDANAEILLGGVNTVDFGDHHSTIIGHPVTGDAGIVKLTSPTALGPNNVGGNTIEAQLFNGTIDANGQANITIGSLLLNNGATSRLVNSSSNPASFSGTVTLNAANTVFGGNGNMTFNGAIAGSGGINKTGSGVITVSAASSYSGGTVITAGKLQIGIQNALPNSGTISLAGGTLRSGETAGFSNDLGTLNVNGNGTIELGTGSHTLTFAAFDPANFASLTITGWTGTTGATGFEGHVIFTDVSGFATPGVLSNIQFAGYASGAVIITNNELVPGTPIPEPAFLLVVGSLMIGMRRGRSRFCDPTKTTNHAAPLPVPLKSRTKLSSFLPPK